MDPGMDTWSTNLQPHENSFRELVKCSETPTRNPMAAAWVTGWYLILCAYEYKIVHKTERDHLKVDALSMLPLLYALTHWGLVTHICVGTLTIIG